MVARGKCSVKGKAKSSKIYKPKSKTEEVMTTDEEQVTQETPLTNDDCAGSEPENGKPPKGKKPDMLTPDQEQKLSEWFSDQTEKDFKNRSKKERLLEEKAAEFNITGEFLCRYYKTIKG